MIKSLINRRIHDNSANRALLNELPASMFWDVDRDDLSVIDDSNLIISKVLNRSYPKPWAIDILEKIYPVEYIKNVALDSSQIMGNDTIEKIASRYGLSPDSFKKYIDLEQFA